ncbi:hypothetical protein IV203_035450 [Nitzschia inconspicua]|uniref:Uncharacterized protein n=1 Tax=Nitzschia inconspicua TaxID=303405 RepID=A0A9K3LG86_9STRA|nr:hypothetical protein IV203_035450 [Nitzschia inconspicua]
MLRREQSLNPDRLSVRAQESGQHGTIVPSKYLQSISSVGFSQHQFNHHRKRFRPTAQCVIATLSPICYAFECFEGHYRLHIPRYQHNVQEELPHPCFDDFLDLQPDWSCDMFGT